VQEDWSAIECPVLAIGGWADSYTNAVPRLLEGLKTPRKAIIGPWGHIYPQDGVPGPAIGFLQEAVRWWDHWLKGRDTGVMNEPDLRAYINDSVAPTGTRTDAPGRWVGEANWPSPSIAPKTFTLGSDHALHTGTAPAGTLTICSPQSHGKAGGEWMGTGCVGEHPTDQRLDDGAALVFDTPALTESFDVLGAPLLKLRVASDKPVAQVSVRLSDIRPDGTVTRISYQVLNLTHRDSHENPEALVPGQFYAVTVKLNDCGHRFAAGHAIRVAIGTSYWPMVWPSPELATLTIDTSSSTLSLPVRSSNDASVVLPPPAHGPATTTTQLDPGTVRRWSSQDHVAGTTTYVTEGIGGLFGEGILRFDDIGTELSHSLKRNLTISDYEPLSANYLLTQSYQMGRDGWRIGIDSTTEMRADKDTFYLTGTLSVSENGTVVKTREWSQSFPRDLM
jgi:putative CocE/NonD family hydrolase